MRLTQRHYLALFPYEFTPIFTKRQKALLIEKPRTDEDMFQPDDTLSILEKDSETKTYTGRGVIAIITHVHIHDVLPAPWVMVSLYVSERFDSKRRRTV